MTIDHGSLAAMVTGKPRAEYVRRMAATGFGVSVEDLCGDDRTEPLVLYRHVAMAAVRSLTGASYPAIGRLFDRDHTSCMHGERHARKDPKLRAALDVLCDEVRKQWAIDHGQPVPIPGQLDLGPVSTPVAGVVVFT